MSDVSPSTDPNAGRREDNERPSTTEIPRWVKVFVITVIVLVGVMVVMHLTGHNLMNHLPPAQSAAP